MTLSQYQGSILGLAIGDALGHPTEFRSRAQILTAFPPDGVRDFVALMDERWPARPFIIGTAHPPGAFTDDTQMSLAVAHSLLETLGRPLDEQMQAMGRHFVAWSESPENDRAPGGTCMTGCHNLAAGAHWRAAGVPDSKGCGSAMRAAPIGLLYRSDRDRLLEVARASSILTHGHDAAVEGAAAAALLVAMALDGQPPEVMFEALMDECAPRSPDLAACVSKVPGLLDAPVDVALSTAGLGESWVADEAVASALWCFWRHPDDYAACVLTGANTDGDSDSIACIAGSISGARLGLDAIPAGWRERVEATEDLHAVGRMLWDAA